MRTRLILILCAIFLTFLYVGAQLSHGAGSISWILLSVLVAGIFFMPILWRLPDGPVKKLRGPIQLMMALLSFLLAWTVIRDLFFVALLALGSSWITDVYIPQTSLAVWVLALISLVAGLLVVGSGPRVRQVKIKFPKLPDALRGFKIAQISDLHVGEGIQTEYVQNVVNLVQKENPDAVVFTGDIADGDVHRFKKHLEPFRGAFKVPMYYVPGNHEYYHDAKEWFAAFRDIGMNMLFNAHAMLEKNGARLMFAGTVDPTARMLGEKPNPQQAMILAPNESPPDLKILLAHQPGISTEAEKLGYDLQLSGHTHGGQFFPWTLVIRQVHQHYNGLQREGRMWVYVNPGTGHWGPPVRLGTRAEITLITLEK